MKMNYGRQELTVFFIATNFFVSISAMNIQKNENSSTNAENIKKVLNSFAGKSKDFEIKKTDIDGIRVIDIKKSEATYHYFGIHKEDQNHIDFKQYKRLVAKNMGLNENATLVQIIGDSKEFSPEGTIFARKELTHIFENLDKNSIIEYGYTGHDEGKRLCTNALVNEYANNNPQKAKLILANIVGHSYSALTGWKCTASNLVRFFTVVYNDDGMEGKNFTKFGDDVEASDRPCDAMVCIEGGAQSFRQIVNALQSGLPIILIGNVRTEKGKTFFGVATFLNLIKNALDKNEALSQKEVQKLYDDYNKTLASPWDIKSPDSMTKQKLFNSAIEDFILKNIYKNLKLQSFFKMM